MTERDLIIADKLNNARQMARDIQALLENPPSPHAIKKYGVASAVRIEELLAESVSLLKGTT